MTTENKFMVSPGTFTEDTDEGENLSRQPSLKVKTAKRQRR